MIDWMDLGANSLWIVSLAILLAAVSVASWQGSQAGLRVRAVLAKPGYQILLNLAGLLFCAGLALTSPALWERMLWAVLGGFFLIRTVMVHLRRNQASIRSADRT